ncbi:MAG: iron uptake porin [Elainella sp.]
MRQLTSVSQLADVQPTDWAYQALQSLVERYGCIVGYPDGTYRGTRALTRFEFAAGLNACLNRIDELLAASTADLVTKEELATRERLRSEFANELALLRGRMDGLEARVAELESNQFSTTVRLNGSAVMAVSNAFGDGLDNQVIGQYRYRFLLSGSFTGSDNFLLGIYAGNAVGNGFDTGGFDLPGLEVSDPTGTTVDQISTQEGGLASTIAATTDNSLLFLASAYSFPVGDQLMVNLSVGRTPYYFFTPTLNGLYTSDEGTGAIGTFARLDPVYLLVGGGTGVVFNYNITDSLELTAGYLADGGTVGDPSPGSGLFNGGYGVLGQLTWQITDGLSVAGVYAHDYAPGGRFGFNNNGLGSTGTAIANTLAGQDLLGGEDFGLSQEPVVTNGYSAQFSWEINPQLVLSGWFGTYYTRLIERGDGNILTYALTFAVRDLFQDGNLLGLAVGAEPYLTRMGGDPVDFDVDIPLHVEAFYRYQITDNISVTPGVIWLTAPNQSADNPDAVIATLRTTFEF